MTREEAKMILEDNKPSIIFEDEELQKRSADLCMAIDMAISALEQKSCEDLEREYEKTKALFSKMVKDEDTISREDALGQLYEWVIVGEYEYENAPEYLRRRIKALPPVTPSRRKGHWIEQEDFNGDTYYDCSECKESFCLIEGTPTDNLYNFCPNCGAEMVEPQESDHKCHTCKHYTSGERDGSCDSYICKHYSDWESEDKE